MKNNIHDVFESFGPTEAEKQQMFERLQKPRVRRKANLRPVAILAASLALFAVMAMPFATQWFQPDEATIEPGTNVPTAAAPVSPTPSAASYSSDGLALLYENTISLNRIESIDIGSLHQEIQITFTDSETMTIRQYDRSDSKVITVSQNGSSVIIKTSQNEYNGKTLGTPRFEIEMPSFYKGDVKLSTVSGSVMVADGAEWDTVDIGTVSGNVNIETLTAAGNVELGTVSGNVKAHTVKGQIVNCGSVSGNVTVDSIISETYSLSSVSGNVTVGSVTGTGDASSVSGITTINGVVTEPDWPFSGETPDWVDGDWADTWADFELPENWMDDWDYELPENWDDDWTYELPENWGADWHYKWIFGWITDIQGDLLYVEGTWISDSEDFEDLRYCVNIKDTDVSGKSSPALGDFVQITVDGNISEIDPAHVDAKKVQVMESIDFGEGIPLLDAIIRTLCEQNGVLPGDLIYIEAHAALYSIKAELEALNPRYRLTTHKTLEEEAKLAADGTVLDGALITFESVNLNNSTALTVKARVNGSVWTEFTATRGADGKITVSQ